MFGGRTVIVLTCIPKVHSYLYCIISFHCFLLLVLLLLVIFYLFFVMEIEAKLPECQARDPPLSHVSKLLFTFYFELESH